MRHSKQIKDPLTDYHKIPTSAMKETLPTYKSKKRKEKNTLPAVMPKTTSTADTQRMTLITPNHPDEIKTTDTYERVMILHRSSKNVEQNQQNNFQAEPMNNIQTSLDCPEIEMHEPTNSELNTEPNTTQTALLRYDSHEPDSNEPNIIIIKMDLLPINVTTQELYTTLAE